MRDLHYFKVIHYLSQNLGVLLLEIELVQRPKSILYVLTYGLWLYFTRSSYLIHL